MILADREISAVASKQRDFIIFTRLVKISFLRLVRDVWWEKEEEET